MSLHLPSRRDRRVQVDSALSIVNIVLLLIFYFLLTGQAPRVETPLQLARTAALSAEELPSPVLEIRGPQDWLLDGAAIGPEMLPAALASSPGPVHLLIDRAAPSSLLMAVLRRPELADHDLRLVTLKESAP